MPPAESRLRRAPALSMTRRSLRLCALFGTIGISATAYSFALAAPLCGRPRVEAISSRCRGALPRLCALALRRMARSATQQAF
jgi:hypothetical protein